MRKAAIISALSFALSVYPYTSNAETKAEKNLQTPSPVFKLGEIAVSVADENPVAGSRTVITQQELQTYTHTDTLESAVSKIAGVDVTQVGRKNETSVSIRGFDMRQIVLMIDGVPVVMPYDAYPDLARVLTTDLSEIQVSKGLGSVLAGPNALGGIINMVSKRPSKKFQGDVSVQSLFGDTGAFNGFRSSMNVGTNQGLYYVQAGLAFDDVQRWRLSDDFKPVTSQNGAVNQRSGQRDNSQSKDKKVNLKVGFTPNDTDEYTLSYVYQNGQAEIPPYAGYAYSRPPSSTPREAVQLTMPFWREYPYWNKQSVYALSNTALGKTGYVKTKLFYDTFKNRMDGYTDSLKTQLDLTRGFPSFYNDYGLGGSIEAGADLLPKNTTKMAFHYRRDHHEEQKYSTTLKDRTPIEKTVDDTYSVALENTFHASTNFDIIFGASYDWIDVKQADGLDQNNTPFVTNNDHSLNPMMALRYRYSNTGAVYAGVAQKSRFATQKARYSYKSGTAIPNPDLDAEKAINYEIGLTDTINDRLSLDMAVFYSSVRDTNLSVLLTSGANTGKYQTQNFGRSAMWGAEIGSRLKITNAVDMGLAYTFLRKELTDTYGLKPIDAPRHKLTVYGDWRVNEEVRFVPTIDAYSSRYSTLGGNNVVGGAVRTEGVVGTSKDGTRVAGFMTAGLKALYTPKKDLEFSIGVANIFDKDYSFSEGYPQQGRNYFLTMTSKF